MSSSGDKNKYWVKRAGEPIDEASVSPDASSLGYERWSRAKLQRWTLTELDRLAPRRPDGRWEHLVDLGCGFGDFTAAFAPRARRVTACDLAPAFAAEARRRLATVGHEDAIVVAADVVGFDEYADASVVYLGGVLTYLDDDDARTVIRRVRERLLPGAVVAQRDWCVIGLGREKVNRSADKFSVHRRPSTYVKLFAECGLVPVKRRISPYIYGEQMTREAVRAEWAVKAVGWLPQALWRLGTLHWYDCSATFFYRLP